MCSTSAFPAPWGKPLGDTPGNFGNLPPEECGPEAYVAPDSPVDYPEAIPGKENAPGEFSPKNRWRRWLRQMEPSRPNVLIYWVLFILLMGAARSCAPSPHY